MTVEDRLRAFLTAELAWDGRAEVITDDFPLIERGIVDSMGILSLVSYIESEFAVAIRDEELVPEHFGTLAGMARLIAAKAQLRATARDDGPAGPGPG